MRSASLSPIRDWRDPGSYPSEEKLIARWRADWQVDDDRVLTNAAVLAMWRWEFLRRKDDYRTAFVEQHIRSQEYWDTLGIDADQRRAHEQFGARHLSNIANQYGLEFVPAPEWEFRITATPLFRRTFGFAVTMHTSPLPDYQHLIAFDARLPLSPQLDKAREYMEALQTEAHGKAVTSSRHHRAQWPRYLRSLDARAAGETYEAIWEVLKPPVEDLAAYDRQAGQNFRACGHNLLDQARSVQTQLTAFVDSSAPK